MTDALRIRSARPDDLGALPVIEHAAAAQFRTTPYAELADDDPVSAAVDLEQEVVWVAVVSSPLAIIASRLSEAGDYLHR